ncbi:DUF202 domain containing protein [Nitzschia inconspicua]|uniref:DUF202 domain containing protein n=1 Tax=Nitzschia inconspicua TaxID=303405 RepID=A0A9K3Q3C5_9STRA|nr:DUF202 domain containing protein [Nitzschia inconspicua]
MGSRQERTPLLGSNGSGSGGNTYYFNNTTQDNSGRYNNNAVSDTDGGQVVESLPTGASAQDFEPRMINATTKKDKNLRDTGIFGKLFGGKGSIHNRSEKAAAAEKKMVKPRSAPIKVEPKVFFANERTFLAWMHISIILAGASIAILAFTGESTNVGKQIYGLIMLPVAISFIVYAMYQYTRRAYMIRNKLPGPYDDTVGPTVLGIMLMISITAQFAIKLMTITRG